MPKAEQPYDLALRARSPSVTLRRWFYDELRAAILEGRLTAGMRLPSSRSIARQHRMARGTVVAAFEQLCSEGFVECRVGSGTVVRRTLPAAGLGLKGARSPALTRGSRAALSARGRLMAEHPFPKIWSNRTAPVFRLGLPAFSAFPLELWSRIAARRMRQATPALLSFVHALGYRPLRMEIAGYLGLTRGVKCTADQIVITSGTQQSLDLVARLVLDPGDQVWVENPGYPAAAALFRAVGAKVIAVPVDDEGIDCRSGRARCRLAKMAYVTPGCQFPLGITMSLARRLQLLGWARENDGWVFEDDYDGEFRFSGRPLAALHSLDGGECVIYSNSFNKVLFPTLRLGFLVVPMRMVEAVAAAKSIIDRFPPVLDQAILCDFISEGHMANHIRRMREIYASRFDFLVKCTQSKLAGLLEISQRHPGLQAVGWLANGIRDGDACRMAAERGLDSVALSALSLNRSMPPALILGVASAENRAIRAGVAGLGSVLRELKNSPAG